MIAAAQRAGRSLSAPDRNILDRARTRAIVAGYGWNGINALEMEGERGVRGTFAFPISARYIGSQEGGMFGLSFRMYNIEGDHRLNNSTVGVLTLIHEGIHIGDLSRLGILRETAKELAIMGAWYFLSTLQVAKIKLGARS